MVTIDIPGKAVGKGRPKFARQGLYVQTFTPAKTVEYENLVRLTWMQSGAEKLNGPIEAIIIAYFKVPSSVSKKKRAELEGTHYLHKPDGDNICKSVLDALNGIAFDDDSQVAKITIEKLYAHDDTEKVTLILKEIEYAD